jgi:hypothetical protein
MPHKEADAAIVRNGIFLKLAVVAFCLSWSSSASYWLSFLGGRLANDEGSPSDEAILYSFLYGLALSQAITLFLPSASLRRVASRHFALVLLHSLPIVIPCWLVIALGGSSLVDYIFAVTRKALHEQEWYQISLVLLSTSLTLLTWHFMYHRQRSRVPRISERGSNDEVTTSGTD